MLGPNATDLLLKAGLEQFKKNKKDDHPDPSKLLRIMESLYGDGW
jgi:hypothetical protein